MGVNRQADNPRKKEKYERARDAQIPHEKGEERQETRMTKERN